jgi:hypothetical protein
LYAHNKKIIISTSFICVIFMDDKTTGNFTIQVNILIQFIP